MSLGVANEPNGKRPVELKNVTPTCRIYFASRICKVLKSRSPKLVFPLEMAPNSQQLKEDESKMELKNELKMEIHSLLCSEKHPIPSHKLNGNKPLHLYLLTKLVQLFSCCRCIQG